MKRKVYMALASSALMLTLALSGAPEAYAVHDGHDHAHERARQSRRARRHVSKARKSSVRRAVSYACPMHPDMRSRSRGECPKCGMSMVAAKRGAKPAAATKGEDVGANDAHPKL